MFMKKVLLLLLFTFSISMFAENQNLSISFKTRDYNFDNGYQGIGFRYETISNDVHGITMGLGASLAEAMYIEAGYKRYLPISENLKPYIGLGFSSDLNYYGATELTFGNKILFNSMFFDISLTQPINDLVTQGEVISSDYYAALNLSFGFVL